MKMSQIINEKRQYGKRYFGHAISITLLLCILMPHFIRFEMHGGTLITIGGIIIGLLCMFHGRMQGWGTDEELLSIYAGHICKKSGRIFTSEVFECALREKLIRKDDLLSMDDGEFQSYIRNECAVLV